MIFFDLHSIQLFQSHHLNNEFDELAQVYSSFFVVIFLILFVLSFNTELIYN